MTVRPDKALILAAGFGTRLLPLTRVVPKPLLPLLGKPMIDRALDMVQAWGVRDAVVNVHHGADAVVRHLINRNSRRLRIQISFEPEILGTGGAVTKASWFFAGEKPFWMVNADVAADINPLPLMKAFRPGKTMASAWLMATRGPRTVECRKGMIKNFSSGNPGAEGTYTFCGVHLVDPAVLEYLPASGFASIIKAYQDAMKDGWKIAGVPVEDAKWADIGTPEQYLDAHREFSRNGRKSFVSVSPGAVIEKGAILHNCVVLSGAYVERGVLADSFIIGPNVRLKTSSGIMAMRARDALDKEELALTLAWTKSPLKMVACPLAPRGSARSFTRLYAAKHTAILIRHKPEREENNLYAGHTRFLKKLGVPVPAVLAEDRKEHLTLFEDSGVFSVQDLAPQWMPRKLEIFYRRVLGTMIVFHETGCVSAKKKNLKLMPPFNQKLYAWEHDLFTDLFLRDRMGVKEKTIRQIDAELKRISKLLLTVKPVLVHRDLQSSNIILKSRRWSLIDYQGMRFGPAVYDLASLLCDPYIRIDKYLRARLLSYYAERADPESACHEMFWSGAVQRLGQALGAYARLGKLPGAAHFTKYINPALVNLREALDHMEHVPVLSGVVYDCMDKTSK